MRFRTTLRVAALAGLAVGAVSFAVVDVTTSLRACRPAGASCAHAPIPLIAIAFAALGVFALAVGVIAAVLSVVRAAEDEDEPPIGD